MIRIGPVWIEQKDGVIYCGHTSLKDKIEIDGKRLQRWILSIIKAKL